MFQFLTEAPFLLHYTF